MLEVLQKISSINSAL